MRNMAIQYVGIDVHQSTLVCVCQRRIGQTMVESKVATQSEPIRALLRGLGGRVKVVFEEGTQAQWLYEVTRPLVDEVIV